MSAHTPGPWRTEYFSGAYSIHGMLGGRTERRDAQLAEVRNFTPHPTPGERAEIDANAALIAAAPELLELAQLVMRETEEDENGDMPDHPRGALYTLRKAAQAVLAKAEGRR